MTKLAMAKQILKKKNATAKRTRIILSKIKPKRRFF